MIELSGTQRQTVLAILAARVPGLEVRAFGSRVTGRAKPYSDLDLAVVGERALDPDVFRRLREDFEESDLSFRVDVLDWHGISAEFQRIVAERFEVLQAGRPGTHERRAS